MTTAIVLQKATKPAFLIGGFILLLFGAALAIGRDLSVGEQAGETATSPVSKKLVCATGVVFIICALAILHKGFKG